MLLVYVYGPDGLTEAMRPWLRLLLFPVLSLSGLALWKQAQLRRFLAGVRGKDRAPLSS
ncbi:hypothetical protein [Streptomyces sp. NPDC056987]|uniref:hypothetical protein n=1 Tax=Streptomyces sp. NPDC056987 TaxID=3345988 RepID=UPI00363F8650